MADGEVWHLQVDVVVDAEVGEVADALAGTIDVIRRDRDPMILQQHAEEPQRGWNGSLERRDGRTVLAVGPKQRDLNGLVATLDDADPAERRAVYAATGLTVEYDHEGRRARLSSTPSAEVWSSVRVGGGT